jgi:hypothetical protein
MIEGAMTIPQPDADLSTLRSRSPEAVLRDHLALRDADDVERDISRNYALSVVVIRGKRTYTGHDGVRQCATELQRDLPNATFEYHTVRAEQEIGFLEWSGANGEATIEDGTDSFLIRDGHILIQTIHYRVAR